jgi:RHS repeat-associated protein
MLMPGRGYSATGAYRYGFNWKENDNEVKGEGGQQDYGMRIYDPRLGRFLSVDPLMKEYPWNSTYAFAENDVVRCIDLEGAEKHVQTFFYTLSSGQTVSKVISNDYVQAKGTVNVGTLLGLGTPTTDEEDAARYIVQYHNLPSDGTFSFFEFSSELNKQKYARYDYTDANGRTQSQYFSAEIVDKTFEGYRTSHERNARVLNIYASLANLAGLGALLKSELKAASSEFKAAINETKAATPGPSLKTAGGSTISNSKWAEQFNPTAWAKGYNVPVKSNGYPDFSRYLYTGGVAPVGAITSMNTVKIKMTGNYAGDFAAANKAAGFSATPEGYTWHHTEVMGELQLVKTEAHAAARHSGGVQLYREQNNGQGYR